MNKVQVKAAGIIEGEYLPADRTATSVIESKEATSPAQLYVALHGGAESKRVAEVKAKHVALLLGYKDPEDIKWPEIRFEHASRLRDLLLEARNQYGELLSPSTQNHTLTAFRQMAKYAWRLKLISMETYEGLRAIERIKGSRLANKKLTPSDNIVALLDECLKDPSVAGPRDAAIIILAFGAGLRRSEIVSIYYPRHLNLKDGTVRIIGKGNKQRDVPLAPYMCDVLRTWIEDVRGEHEGPLFSRIRKGGDVGEKKLSSQSVYYILEQRCIKCGIDPVRPHDARRSFGSNLLSNNVDLKTVSLLLGHESIVTTQIYILIDDEQKRNAVNNKLTLFNSSTKLAKS